MKTTVKNTPIINMCSNCGQPHYDHFAIGKLKSCCPILEGRSGMKFKLDAGPMTDAQMLRMERAFSFTPFYERFVRLKAEIDRLKGELSKGSR